MNAAEIDGPSVDGAARFCEHVDEAEDGADDAHRRGEAAGLLERLADGRVTALAMASISDSRIVGDQLGVGAVDDELQAVAGERVLDLAELRVERQQAVATGLVGERDEPVELPAHVGRFG